MVGVDLAEFLDERRMVDGEASEARERPGRGLVAAHLDVVARRFRQDEHARDQDDGPRELDGDGNAVRAGIVTVLGAVVDDGGEEEPHRDGELVAAHDDAADPLGRRLGLVQRDQRGQQADAEAGEEAAGDEEGDRRGRGLEDDAKGEDEARCYEAHPAADPVA